MRKRDGRTASEPFVSQLTCAWLTLPRNVSQCMVWLYKVDNLLSVHCISGRLRQICDGFGDRSCDVLSKLPETVDTLRCVSIGRTKSVSRSERHGEKCP